MEYIAKIYNGFTEKFGIPRQSGIVPEARGIIRFEKKYRHPDAVRGLEDYDYLWLLWHFDQSAQKGWTATVRPPKIGGNERMGVFATRSPYRPNPIGLSCVRLEEVHQTADGPELVVSGMDLRNGTGIYDIKPYLPYADSHPEARAGFTEALHAQPLTVVCPEELASCCPPETLSVIKKLLAEDPRPGYQQDPERIYGLSYDRYEIRFRISPERILTIVELMQK